MNDIVHFPVPKLFSLRTLLSLSFLWCLSHPMLYSNYVGVWLISLLRRQGPFLPFFLPLSDAKHRTLHTVDTQNAIAIESERKYSLPIEDLLYSRPFGSPLFGKSRAQVAQDLRCKPCQHDILSSTTRNTSNSPNCYLVSQTLLQNTWYFFSRLFRLLEGKCKDIRNKTLNLDQAYNSMSYTSRHYIFAWKTMLVVWCGFFVFVFAFVLY